MEIEMEIEIEIEMEVRTYEYLNPNISTLEMETHSTLIVIDRR
jgi:hypothetical protein